MQATWIAWDGSEWHSCKSFRYVPKEDETDGVDEDEELKLQVQSINESGEEKAPNDVQAGRGRGEVDAQREAAG